MFQSILILALMTFSAITQAALPNDPIQRCLDIRRLADFTTRQKMAAKEPGVLRFKFHKISASELPLDNSVGNMDEVIKALNNQIVNCNKKHAEFQTVTIAGQKFKRQEWCLNTNQKMLALAKEAHGNFQKYLASIKSEFDWYKSDGWPENHAGFKKGEFQFTAYYAPAPLEARTKYDGAFLYPIYSNPGVVQATSESKKLHLNTPLCGVDPLTKIARGFCLKNANNTYSLVPDREEINHGALNPKYIIGYVKDPNDPAFLMLQGSGSLLLDGKLFRLNYDGANGRPRTMLGRIVQCAQDPTCGGNLNTMERCAKDPKCHDEAKLRCNVSKKIKQSGGSEKLIRQYLNSLPPEKAEDLRNRDQSFVFFAKEDGGPYGSDNIPLTPHASCATDHRVIPIGMNFIYQSKKTTSWCVAQDAGGAIVGAHVDVYKGEGNQAGIEANGLNHAGSLYVALPKQK
ncbi:MltA domain-containing protein [Legionella longbeachae]|uniref:peptidoglycan lytic exotransglycosylase n=1 Tax=Legionella longbeachae serogroup 1 (strain NSW150) TaxID=661367 RepID=D3HJL1_LEGLN|nr:MltA domain-containing protein [Legionella longbeachae]VEE03139.1 membrane-bound lytic murein transglycosylase A [Legionella oakridgensis]HBD7398943.1 MltA domain-containing protein [Legionella pneumophila]ARB93960.1 murein transglycosylase [Legionella longbeachae]ARM32901.1 murein transglycosylase [Legionella longbeachae]EEZ94286.1 putative membrane-bound lytic murein transglycosylase A [Legionella longbeachae D-4968]